MRRGWLEVCILNLLEQRQMHGYAIMQQLQGIPGLGITEGSLYPLLSRLRVQGLIHAVRLEESPDGPARKIYELTPKGKRILTAMNEQIELMQTQQQIAKRGGVSHD